MRKIIAISIPEEVLMAVDVKRGKQGRSGFVSDSLRETCGMDSGSSGSLKGEPKTVLHKDYLDARIPHLPVEAVPVFRKVIGSVGDVEGLVGAVVSGKGDSGEEVEAGGGESVEVVAVSGVGEGEAGREFISAVGAVDRGVQDGESVSEVTVSVRKFPNPKCPRCGKVMTDEGTEFVCGKGNCKQKPWSVELVEEKWEREQGE